MDKYITPAPGFHSDSAMIQDAVDRAEKDGTGKVIIPCINPRTGEKRYVIDETILLPSDIEVILDNCYMALKEGVYANIFRNRNMRIADYNDPAEEQHNITIRGVGHAVLDSLGHNDVFEWSSNTNGYPSIYVNNYIVFYNVDGFEVSNLEVRNQRWWAINFIYCSNGYIADITSKAHAEHSNQDGVNLRTGCHHITIERISGSSGDDLVALTAMGRSTQKMLILPGKSIDLHDVVVRDIIGTSVHEGIVTLRAHDGRQMYNILIENIIESNFEDENNLPYGTILIGQNYFFGEEIGKFGSMRNITVKNVYTKSGGTTITLGTTLVDSSFENIRTENTINAFTTVNYDHEGCTKVVERAYGDDGIKIKNVTVSDIFVDENIKGTPIDLKTMRDEDFIEEMDIKNVHYSGNNEIVEFCKNGKSHITLEGVELV